MSSESKNVADKPSEQSVVHTPGPWGWQGGRLVALGGINKESETVLWPENATYEDTEQLGPDWWKKTLGACGKGVESVAHKNAMLIAAAPELLEALRLLWTEVAESGNGTANDFGWKRAREATCAVLRKVV